MTTAKPTTPAEHIARAREELARDGGAQYAIAHALVAIAELLDKSSLPPVDAQQCRSATGARRCKKRAGHDGWHDDGSASWPDIVADEGFER